MDDIAIIGAGLGGLTLALALARLGQRPVVYEQAEHLGEVGAGITLSPNSTRIFRHLGLGGEIERLGFAPGRQLTQHWQTGETILEFERGPELSRRYGAPYLHIHRSDLHASLVAALRETDPDAIQLGCRLVRVSTDRKLAFANGTESEASVVVGADGLHSLVRACLFGDVGPTFTGQVAWRGIVPVAQLPAELAETPPGIHIGPGRLFMRYPVRNGALLNYAAFVELQGWEEESWSIPSTITELLGHFEGWDDSVRTIISATPANQLYKWALHTREPLESWTSAQVTLLGDAAHAMLPFMGQGAATAIEDGMVLARCLAGFNRDEALRRYEHARLDRTTMVQTQSRLLGLKFQSKDPEQLGRGPIQNEESLGLFDYDAVTVAI